MRRSLKIIHITFFALSFVIMGFGFVALFHQKSNAYAMATGVDQSSSFLMDVNPTTFVVGGLGLVVLGVFQLVLGAMRQSEQASASTAR